MSAPRVDYSSSWMTEDDDDFEHGSCTSFCASPGQLLCKYLRVQKKQQNEADGPQITEGVLRSHDFDLQQTFRHGLPQQPTCLAFDAIHQLLAVGSEHGSVVILGKAGIETHLDHQVSMAIRQMLFIEDQGVLVTLCSNGNLSFWDIKRKQPVVVAKLEVGKGSRVTCMSWVGGSSRMMVGTDRGSVHAVDISSFQATEESFLGEKFKCAGKVIDIALHPMDLTRMLIAYSEKVVLVSWSAVKKKVIKQYNYIDETLSALPAVMSVCWKGNDHQFAVFFSNGIIHTFMAKSKSNGAKPREKLSVHDHVTQALPSSHGRVRYLYLNQFPCLASSESVAKSRISTTRHSLVLYRKAKGTVNPILFSYCDPVVDFLPIPQFPFAQADAKALAVLTEKELIVHDLLADKAPIMSLPFALDINLSPVTAIELCSNCPQDFMAKLQSFQAKIDQFSSCNRPWPLNGGGWGDNRLPKSSEDLVITGHLDGSVCFWHCCSASMMFLFNINTFTHFKERFGSLDGGDTSSTDSTPSPFSHSLPADDNYFAIHLISMDVRAEALTLGNGGGHVMVFDFLKLPPDFSGSKSESNIQSLIVDFSCDQFFTGETKHLSFGQTAVSSSKVFNKSSHGVFRMLQHCRCYFWEKQYKHAVVVTALKYCSPMNLLTIGSSSGLAVVCTKTNSVRKILCNPLSLFYVANPQSFKKRRSVDVYDKFPELAGRRGRRRSSGVRVLSDETSTPVLDLELIKWRQRVFTLREELFPLLPSSLATAESLNAQDQKEMVAITCLDLVYLRLKTGSEATLTLWVGTHCGNVAVYNVDTTDEIDIQDSGVVLKKGSKIVSFYFIDENGDEMLTPYRQTTSGGKLESFGTQFAIITTQRSIQSVKFPGNSTVGNADFRKYALVRSGMFYCRDTPCLLNLTSEGEVVLHSLPSLRHLRTMSCGPLAELRALHTFHVSESGQGLYFFSPSQIQRFALLARNDLDYPRCLPDLINPNVELAIPARGSEGPSFVTDIGLQLAQSTFQSPSWEAPAVGKAISSKLSLNLLTGTEPQREANEQQQVQRRHSSCTSEPFSAESRKGSVLGDHPLSTHYRFVSDAGSNSSHRSSTESLELKITDDGWSTVDQPAHTDIPLERPAFSVAPNLQEIEFPLLT